MDGPRYTVGVDFGTESARAVLVDLADGSELGVEVYAYRNGVIDATLPAPDGDVVLGPDWALQDPEDYVETFRTAVRTVVERTAIDPRQVVGIGIGEMPGEKAVGLDVIQVRGGCHQAGSCSCEGLAS